MNPIGAKDFYSRDLPQKLSFRVLVVEDSHSDVSLLKQILKRSPSVRWDLTVVERLQAAIASAREYAYDLVLLDLSLPDSEGLQTVSDFIDAVPDLPVVVLTIANDENLAIKAIARGAQDYLIKGEITPQLLARSLRYSRERGRLVRELKQATAEMEAFSYAIAHDVREPLRGIYGFAHALKEDYGRVLEVEGNDFVNQIENNAQRLETLFEDILTYGRLSSVEVQLQPVILAEIVREAMERVREEVTGSQAQIEVSLDLMWAIAAPALFRQTIVNLLTNAIKFVSPGQRPQIKIWAEERSPRTGEKRVRLWVEDNGIGIAPDKQKSIFDIFERLHGIESYPGTGIGLAICRRAVEKMSGTIGVDSQIGKGSRFWVELLGVRNS